MKRSQAIELIKAAAAVGDMKACTRLYAEARISRSVYDEAVEAGRAFGAFVAKRDAQVAA